MNKLFDDDPNSDKDGEELEFDLVLEGDDDATEEEKSQKTEETTHESSDNEDSNDKYQENSDKSQEDDDTKSFGKRAEKRIGKLTKDKYELEARLAELERKNAELAQRAQDSDLTVAETRRRAVALKENQLVEAKKTALAQLAAAKSNGDFNEEVRIQDLLDNIRSESRQLSELKLRLENPTQTKTEYRSAQPEAQQQQGRQAPIISKRAAKWFTDNPWIKEDRVMVAATEQIHNQILDEGFDPREDEDEYFSELDARLQKVFPSLIKKKKGATQTVDGGKPSMARQGTPGKVNVTLTKQEREFAKKMGISEKDYAKEKFKIMQRKGEA